MDTSLAHLANEAMHVQTSVVPGASHSQATAVPRRCPEIMPYSNCHISKLTPPIKVFLRILESSRHELCKAHGLTLMTHSLCGWEAFPTPRALTHTRITWALSPIGVTSPGCHSGVPLVPMVFRAVHMVRCTTNDLSGNQYPITFNIK